ncbi:MAG: LytTR family DNA-binding domain-containing protein, partial [Bacteroidota bacterium]|nr:LytTR family DNA-binding domain-containing protein [Bacteroidota bacterium]
MLRTIVVDDERLSREVLCNYIREYCPDVEIITTSSSIKSAYRIIKKHTPDLVFLDIEMADGKGFELPGMFEKVDFRIIFVTAYSEYAVKAFRYNAIDYLLKPVKIDELKEAVEKVRLARGINPAQLNLGEIISNFRNGSSAQIPTLVIPHLKGFEVLKIAEIIMCQADGYCTNFFLMGGKKVISSKNLKYFDDILEDHNIIRVHHSYLVNLNHVSGYSRQGEIMLTENHK